VIPLQDIPHRFFAMHAWQMWNPQRQLQLKGVAAPQQWQASARRNARFSR
jgi:hypothetical protein